MTRAAGPDTRSIAGRILDVSIPPGDGPVVVDTLGDRASAELVLSYEGRFSEAIDRAIRSTCR